MNTYRKNAIIVGALFITATVAGILSVLFLSDLAAPNYLADLSANKNQLIIGLLLEFAMAALIAGIAIAMYPILKFKFLNTIRILISIPRKKRV